MTNTEIVQDLYAAFRRGDIPAILAQLDENVSWEAEGPAQLLHAGIRKGPKEVVGFFEGLAKEHAEPELTITDVLSTGDAVATFGRYGGVMRTSGKRFSVPIGHLWKLRNGKVVRYVGLVDNATLLAAM